MGMGLRCGLTRMRGRLIPTSARSMKAMLYLLVSGAMMIQILTPPSDGRDQHRLMQTFQDMVYVNEDNTETYHFTDKWNYGHLSKLDTPGRLEFVHITKTGGSAIEKAGAMHGVIWGACHFMTIDEIGCNSPDIPYIVPEYQSYILTSPWHTPPKLLANHSNQVELPNPYVDAELFAVVRNPYDRVVSEFYCPWMGFFPSSPDQRHNATKLNIWVKEMIRDYVNQYTEFQNTTADAVIIVEEEGGGGGGDNNDEENEPRVIVSPVRRLLAQKHFINQVEYIFDENDNQIVNHIIHYEHLQEEFDNLMREFHLDITLPSKDDAGGGVYTHNDNTGVAKLTFRDLDDESVALINAYAKDDFDALGYEMVDTFQGNNTEYEYQKEARGLTRVRRRIRSRE